MSSPYVNSPNLPTGDKDIVKSAKDFSGAMTLDLSDEEIKIALETTVSICRKHQAKWIQKMPFDNIEVVADLLEDFEKELAYTLMERVDCLVKVDGTPVFEGKGPIVEWLGKVDTSSLAKYGQDHEKKTWEVQKAADRGEDYLNQKDNYRSQ